MGEIADIVRDEMKRMNSNPSAVPAAAASASASAPAAGGEAPGKSKGILGLGFFGLAETGTVATSTTPTTKGEAQTMAKDVNNILKEDPDMPSSTKKELKELEVEAKKYNSAGALQSSLFSMILAAVMALFFF